MIGAPDMALPRMNNWSASGCCRSPFAAADPVAVHAGRRRRPAAGRSIRRWCCRPAMPFRSRSSPIHLMGASSIMGAINIIATILNMRAPGMTLMKMPLFVWTWLITAYLLIAVMPVLAGAVTMLLTDQFFGTSFFNAAGGGDPVMFQHIFWFFGHPEVYIMILPAFGIVSQIIPTFCAQAAVRLRRSMVYATASIAFLSFIVWAHHMFTVGMPLAGELFFMLRDHADRGADRGEGVQLGVDHVARLADLRDADAVRARLRVPVHHRRLLGPDAGHRPGRLPVPRHLLRRGALPLRAGAGRGVRDHGAASTTGCRSGPATCTTRSWASGTSGCRRSASTCCSSRSTSWGWPACRAASPTTALQFADFNMISSIGAFLLRPLAAAVRCTSSSRRIRGGAEGHGSGVGRRARGLEWTRAVRRRRTTPSTTAPEVK
ncbi:MAG: cbb3-type cytochrome c oxidase subunit I [Chromatiales bacterium]|nr:cbb3-type cytochrome c oxidase subunit I [Chromatiales bacterium]